MSFKEDYYNKIRPKIKDRLKLKNIYSTPSITKVVINIGVGEAVSNKKAIERVSADLVQISGQKPIVCKARKSVSAFKIRKGLPIGVKATLRGKRAYDFIEKIIKIVLPRIRDFRGIKQSKFDGKGNLNIGISDQTLFPEIDYDTIDKIRGLEVTVVTTAKTNKEAIELFKEMGMPIVGEDKLKNNEKIVN